MTVQTVPKLIGDNALRPINLGAVGIIGNTLEGQAYAILAKYGASIYLPSTQNCSDNLGVTPAVNDGLVGYVGSGKGDANAHPATQPTAGFKPQLVGGARNLQIYSDDATHIGWSGSTGGVASVPIKTANYGVAPDGTTTACRVQFALNGGSTTADISSFTFPTIPYTSGLPATASVYVKTTDGSTKTVKFVTPDGGLANVSITGSWERIQLASTPGISSTGNVRLRLRGAEGTSDSADIQVWHPQYELGSTAGPYVPTTSAAASQGSRPKAWMYSAASSQRLALSGVPFQMSDDHAVIVCCKPSNATATQRSFAIASTSSNTPRVGCIEYTVTACYAQANWIDDAGGGSTIASSTSLLGIAHVASAVKQGNNKRLRVNGVQVGATSATAVGATTVNAAAFGTLPIAAPTTFFDGPQYGGILLKGAPTDAELLCLERYLGSLGGLSI